MTAVPCNGCRRCCQRSPVPLVPEAGDRVDTYDTVMGTKGVHFLRILANGDCVYLGPHGCTIHDRVPYACRIFDCRQLFARYTRKERREGVKAGLFAPDVLERGRELLEAR